MSAQENSRPPSRILETAQSPFRDPGLLLASTLHGIQVGVVQIALVVSYAALIFSATGAYLPRGIGTLLLGSIIITATFGLLSALPGTIGHAQDSSAAVLATVSAGVAMSSSANLDQYDLFITISLAVAIATICTGIVFYILGRLQLGNLIRFLPYPVVGGFLAATGWLLATGGIKLMTNGVGGAELMVRLFDPDMLMRWLPGVGLTLLIVIVLSRLRSAYALPIVLLVGLVAFYAIALLSGHTVTQLSDGNWLLGPFPSQGLWRPLTPDDIARADWSAIIAQGARIASVTVIATISLLLNASGIETAIHGNLPFNRELRMAGMANILAGLGGGVVGYHSLSQSVLTFRIGARNRVVPLVAATVCLLTLLQGAAVVALFPRMVIGSVIIYLGVQFLKEWLVDTWRRLPTTDYAIIVAILVVTAIWGFLPALTVGIMAAIGLFVVSYSRGNVVWSEMSATHFRSRTSRNLRESAILDREGERVPILRLQGFIFFGTAENLLERLQQRLNDPNQPRVLALMLDFERVSGLDSTTLHTFSKLAQLAVTNQSTLALSGMQPEIEERIISGIGSFGCTRVFPDLERSIAWCEDLLLTTYGDAEVSAERALLLELARMLDGEEQARTLLAHFTPVSFPQGAYLMRRGDPADVLYLIETGQVTAQIAREDGEPLRLQTMGGGNVVGELGFFLRKPRTADVVADVATTAFELRRSQMEHLSRDHPQAVQTLQQAIIHLLADRVVHLVNAVDALHR